ncbi:MFS transporter [Altererythrobacter sp. CAU 1778]
MYALAWAGGAVAYVPFLTILLPVQVARLAGAEAVQWLAYIAFTGAISASIANVAFGWLSDRTHNRKTWILVGLSLSCALLVATPAVTTLPVMLALIVAWQLALNMMLAPLAALAGDYVPDRQKGRLGGLMAFAPALGAASATLVTLPGLAEASGRVWLVAGIVAACVLPVLVIARPRNFPELVTDEPAGAREAGAQEKRFATRHAVVRMWIARLLVQIAEAALFAYLLYWFQSLSAGVSDNDTARIFAMVLLGAIPLAMLAGRWADNRDRPIVPLIACAFGSATGLVTMALASGLAPAIAGYVLFGLSASVFLSLHSAQTLRVLPRPATRGRDLGLFNLTNTVPSLIMPVLTLALVPVFGFAGLFALLATLSIAAAGLLLAITMRARPAAD